MRFVAFLSALLLGISGSGAAETVLYDDFRLDETYGTNEGYVPTVVCDSLGNYSVIWEGRYAGTKARAFHADGSPRSAETDLGNFIAGQVYAAENGSFAAMTAWNTQVDIRRFGLDLTARDAAVISLNDAYADLKSDPAGLGVAMHRNYNVLVGFNDLDPIGGNDWYDVVRMRHLDGSVRVGDWTYKGSSDVGNYHITSLAAVRPDRYVGLFTKQKTYFPDEISRLQTRSFRFTGADIASTSDFETVREVNTLGSMEWDWDAEIVSVYRWHGTVFAYAGDRGLILGRTDTLGNVQGEPDVIDDFDNEHYTTVPGAFDLCAGPGGGYAVAYGLQDNGFHLKWAGRWNASPDSHAVISHPADNFSVAMDGTNRRYAAWAHDGGIFVTRQGEDALSAHRINADGADPRTASAAAFTDGVVSCWTEGDADTAVIAGRSFGTGYSSWQKRVTVLPVLDMPCLAAAGVNAAVLYPSAADGDTSLMLALYRQSNGALVAEIEVTPDGSPSGRAALAVSDTRILVVWEDLRSGASEVYARPFDLNAAAVGYDRKIAAGTAPAVSVDGQGMFAVAYNYTTTQVDYVNGRPVILVRANNYMLRTSAFGIYTEQPRLVNTVANNASGPAVCGTDSTVIVCWIQGSSAVARAYRDSVSLGDPVTLSGTAIGIDRVSCAAVNGSTAVAAWCNPGTDRAEYAVLGADMGVTAPRIMNADPLTDEYPPAVSVSAADGKVCASWIAAPRTGWDNRRLMAQLFIVDGGGTSGIAERMTAPATGSAHADAVRYYDLRGRRVMCPAPGPQLLLRVDGMTGTVGKTVRF